jgi:hypothetical protein
MTSLMPILSEYQNGLRNAKVYKTTGGDYGVIVYDANDDYNGFQSFNNEEDAEIFAEDWVLNDVAI